MVDATPAEAPIISPPIIPEILLERPAAALEVFIQPELPAPTVPTAEEVPSEPAKTKRGRPKAKQVPANAPTPAPTAEATTPVAASSVPEAPVEAPTKKPATRTSKTAKPKAKATKEATKPAATRRGRPPGKKTPPAANEPAT